MEKIKQQIGLLYALVQKGEYSFDTTRFPELREIIEFCETTGAQLSTVLSELDQITSQMLELELLESKALAVPRITVKILKFLPLASLLLGFLFGADILAVFFTVPGLASLAVGVALWLLGQRITSKMVDQYMKCEETDLFRAPVVQLALIKSAVLSGLDPLTPMRYLEVPGSELLERGVPFSAARLPSEFLCLEDAYCSGSSPVGLINSALSLLHKQRIKEVSTKGEQLAVKLTIPLGACYLPSFIAIGVIPSILGMLG